MRVITLILNQKEFWKSDIPFKSYGHFSKILCSLRNAHVKVVQSSTFGLYVPRFLCHFSSNHVQTWYDKRHWLVDYPYKFWSLWHFRFSRYSTSGLYVPRFLCHFSSNHVQIWYVKRPWLVNYPYKIWSLWHFRFSRYSTVSLYVPQFLSFLFYFVFVFFFVDSLSNLVCLTTLTNRLALEMFRYIWFQRTFSTRLEEQFAY